MILKCKTQNTHVFRLPKLLSGTNPKDLLVAGCGTGNEIERFVQTPEHWVITGIDPSPEMIIQARENLKSYDNVTLIKGLIMGAKLVILDITGDKQQIRDNLQVLKLLLPEGLNEEQKMKSEEVSTGKYRNL